MTNKYVIEHDFSYGWDLLNDEEVDAYDSRAEAQEAINDMIAMTEEAFKKGDMDEAYDQEDFRIKKVRVSMRRLLEMNKLDNDEFEFVCDLINQRLSDLEDGETDEGRQVEAKKLKSALDKLSENQING